MRKHLRTAISILSLALLSCDPGPAAVLAVTGSPSRTFSVAVGEEVDITLGTVGPGEYASPPAISSAGVRFLDMAFVGPNVPGGPQQRFRFRADAAGQAVILFQHTGSNPQVSDTVVVH